MRLNENLAPGTLARDVSSEHECPTCEGRGEVERFVGSNGQRDVVKMVPCPDCAGLGVLKERVKR